MKFIKGLICGTLIWLNMTITEVVPFMDRTFLHKANGMRRQYLKESIIKVRNTAFDELSLFVNYSRQPPAKGPEVL